MKRRLLDALAGILLLVFFWLPRKSKPDEHEEGV